MKVAMCLYDYEFPFRKKIVKLFSRLPKAAVQSTCVQILLCHDGSRV